MTTVSRNGYPSTYSYDDNGNEVEYSGKLQYTHPGTITMTYDKENRMVSHNMNGTVTTYTYSGDGLKRSEEDSSGVTTLVWDGSDYVGEWKEN